MKYIFIILLFFSSITFNRHHAVAQKAKDLNKVSTFKENKAFTFGEKLTFKLKYSLYLNINVGEVTFEVKDKPRIHMGRPHYHISAIGSSYSFYSGFFAFRDHYETTIDIEKFLPSISIRVINEGNYHSFKSVIFDHEKKVVKSTTSGETFKIRNFTQDILSAIYLARTFDFQNAKYGDSFMINTFIDDSTYYVGFKVVKRENVKTKMGTFRCVVIKPLLIVDRVFKSDEDMTLWVTDDDNKIPLKAYSGIKVGAVKAELTNFTGIKNPLKSKIK